MQYANNISAIDLESTMPGHVDIPRLRQGKVGGFFWLGFPILLYKNVKPILEHRSVYVNCADPEAEGPEFLSASWKVRSEAILITALQGSQMCIRSHLQGHSGAN